MDRPPQTDSALTAWTQGLDRLLERRRALVVGAFFVALVAVGFATFDDFGVGWDEGNNTRFGAIMLDHVLGKNPHADHYKDPNDFWHPISGQFARTHGPVVEVLLVGLGSLMGVRDSREQFTLRHICIYLIFCGGVFFCYLLGARVTASWRLGLLGALMMALTPRIFAHAFHNSMDIAFMAAFTVTMVTLLGYLEKNTPQSAVLHGVACAVLVDIRIAGLVMPLFTAGFLALEVLAARSPRKMLGRCAITYLDYLLVFCPLAVLLWPMLWGDPVGNLLTSFEVSARDPWSWWELYLGQKVLGTAVPWHFTPVWMLITIPPLYTLLFVAGLARLLSTVRLNRRFYLQHRGALVALCCLVLPLGAVAVLGSTLFNGWRHMYFVYPGFLVLALLGAGAITRGSRLLRSPRALAGVRLALTAALLVTAVTTVRFMVTSHPHQLSYFNLLTGGLAGARERFQFGYWGSEYREGLEYLLRHHRGEENSFTLYVSEVPVAMYPLNFNAMILPRAQRDRINFTEDVREADYFITNHCNHVPRYRFTRMWAREVEGVEILGVYRVPKSRGHQEQKP